MTRIREEEEEEQDKVRYL